ncbi:MAG: gamma-glutamyltransferase, partial [Acidobacteriaceae bacterium]|nr:gamma-glutamyltransferase [Acidobacteriaceae bacterium]
MLSRSVRLWALCALVSFGLPAKEPVKAAHGMVVVQEPLAADVGLTVLKNGGNAVDAAVAVGFALAVTHPVAGNIGGGGFMLVRLANGTTDFLDFRECAPAKASRDMYLGPNGNPTRESIYGWKSAGVPGTVAGLELAHKKFGSQDWKSLVTPAVGLAKDGFTLTEPVAAALRSGNNPLNQDPESKRIFLRDGNPYKTGEVLKQPELASTLDRIARQGAKGFYRGETAKKLAAEMAAHGGFITESDLQDYKVIERSPLTGTYHGYNVITAPPPSAGGVGLLQMMGMLTGTRYESDGPNSPKAVHFVAKAMR